MEAWSWENAQVTLGRYTLSWRRSVLRFPAVLSDESRSVKVRHHDHLLLLSSSRCSQLLSGESPAGRHRVWSLELLFKTLQCLSVSLCPPAGLQPLDAELSGHHVASSSAGQRCGDGGRHRVLPAGCELDLSRLDDAGSAVAARHQLCEAPPTHTTAGRSKHTHTHTHTHLVLM